MRENEYKGMSFNSLINLDLETQGTATWGDKRATFEGHFTIERTEDCAKYGDRVILVVWQRDLPKMEKRTDNAGYSRLEIYLPKDMAIEAFRQALCKLIGRKQISDFLK